MRALGFGTRVSRRPLIEHFLFFDPGSPLLLFLLFGEVPRIASCYTLEFWCNLTRPDSSLDALHFSSVAFLRRFNDLLLLRK